MSSLSKGLLTGSWVMTHSSCIFGVPSPCLPVTSYILYQSYPRPGGARRQEGVVGSISGEILAILSSHSTYVYEGVLEVLSPWLCPRYPCALLFHCLDWKAVQGTLSFPTAVSSLWWQWSCHTQKKYPRHTTKHETILRMWCQTTTISLGCRMLSPKTSRGTIPSK